MERTMCGLSEPTHVTRDSGDMKSEILSVITNSSNFAQYS